MSKQDKMVAHLVRDHARGTMGLPHEPHQQEEIGDTEAREQYRSDWIKAEYETMGWNKEPIDVEVEPLIDEL